LILSVAIVFIICYISSYIFFRIDLTQEKRFTISPVSKNILKKLPDEVLIKVYLDGDIPLGFKRLQKAVREMLDEFRIYAGQNINYQFIDPYSNKNNKAVNDLIKDLYDKGLQPTNVKIKDEKGGLSQKIIIPGAILAYNGIEIPINLLSNNPGLSGEENLNNSLQSLEYNLISNISNITNKKIEKIAFLEGHGELDNYQTGDITRELANYYQVDRGQVNGDVHSLDPYKVIIIAKPQKAFSEEDKFALDQYLMNGGKILWLIDAVTISTDSLSSGAALAYIPQLNIDDQLFKYGIRINPSLVEDIQCSFIPINTALTGSSPKFTPVSWWYYPLLSGSQLHPVSRNINLVKTEFCNYVDTLAANGKLKKTVLLATSKYTKIRNVPCLVALSEVRENPDRQSFNKSFLPVAVLVEGHFESVFKNRMLNHLKLKGNITFKEESKPAAMIVIADGDVIKNDVRFTAQGTLISPLGYDRYTSQTFGNKEFILNAVNYLTDEIGLMSLRTREIKLRLLDREKIRDEKMKWILINTLLPLVFIMLFGTAVLFIMKRKYAK
jgi:gliding-associated putative ABC transporter substrate-binding component GldG